MTKTNRGGVGLWILILVIFGGLIVGVQVGQLYFDHASLEEEAKAVVKNALISQRFGGTKEGVEKVLDWYEATYDPNNVLVHIADDGQSMDIFAPYARKANLFVFEPEITFELKFHQEAPKTGGIMKQMQDSVEDSYSGSEKRYQDSVKKAFSQ